MPKPAIDLLRDAQRAIEKETREILQLEPGTPGSTDPCLYVNFGFREALCISVVDSASDPLRYEVVAEAYAADHGLDAEAWIGECRIEQLPALVKSFLKDQGEVEG